MTDPTRNGRRIGARACPASIPTTRGRVIPVSVLEPGHAAGPAGAPFQ
jgi:hypothetical protein